MSAAETAPPRAPPLFSAERWQELRALAETLAETSGPSREAALQRIAADDPGLAESLRALLADPDDLPTPGLGRLLHGALPVSDAACPTQVGPFHVLQRIGVGGMGSVYLAERRQVDFVQQVALKLLDAGAGPRSQLAARERRILAALAHPHITAFVDAGCDQGRAWMAMEYVQGEALIDHCHAHALGAPARVQLFDQVCDAVAHAHAQLVVHRDLKPSNVLVDTEGRAKLLDFGIALVLDDGDRTAPATRVFTPEYAAPEQLRGERVTTASDIYSLGLMLYELVAGRRLTLDERSSRAHEWSPAELARATTAQGAVEPSGTTMTADTRALARLLRGDLGRIIAHALHPLPARRYPSVASLREDLARWLQQRPLTIVRPDPLYVLRRFVRRHRIALAAAVLGLAAIIGLAATAVWQARAKSHEAAAARAALRESEAIRGFMNAVFLSADPYQGKGALTTAGELLAAARERIDTDLGQEPTVAAALLWQIGNIYVTLGDDAAVKDSLSKALVYNARSAQPSTVLEASARARLLFQDYGAGQATPEQALRGLAEAVVLLRSAGPRAHPELAAALRLHSNVLFASGADALPAATEAVQLLQALGDTHALEYLAALEVLADLLAALERHEEALAAAEQGLAHAYLRAPDRAGMRSQFQALRARALTGLKRYAEAEPALIEAIAASSAAFGAEHFSTRYWRFRLAELLESVGRLDAASAAMRGLLAVAASGTEHRLAPLAHQLTAARIDELRRSAEAGTHIAQAQALVCDNQGYPPFCAKARLLSAESALRERRIQAARRALEACSGDAEIAGDAALRRRLTVLRARLARVSGAHDEARTLLAAAQASTPASADEQAMLDLERGYLALAAGESESAVAALTQARAHLAAPLLVPTPQLREIDAALAAARQIIASDPR